MDTKAVCAIIALNLVPAIAAGDLAFKPLPAFARQRPAIAPRSDLVEDVNTKPAQEVTMTIAETQEFSIDVNPMFESVRIVAGSIVLSPHPQTDFSPHMSVWSSEPLHKTSSEKWLTKYLAEDGGKIVARKPIVFAGMTGEMSKVKDRIEDFDTKEKRDWYRLRAVLTSQDGAVWYHATAMASGPDLKDIEADFERLLGSLRLKLDGEAAKSAQIAAQAEMTAVFEGLKENIDRVSAMSIQQSQEERHTERAMAAAAPVADIEERFDAAVADAGLQDKRDGLRKIVLPTVAMIERDAADPTMTGLSRVGGGPDLPAEADWPRDESGLYLNFLAQINLADLPDRPETLPKSGLMSFFTGSDYSDWRCVYTPASTALKAYTLPADAMDTSISASQMMEWDSDLKRFVANGQAVDGLSVSTDEQGRLTFTRHGAPVRAFASEHEFSRSAQTLRFERSLSAPFAEGGPGNSATTYADLGIEDPADFSIAISERFKIGDGPQHQMFGITGVRDLGDLQDMAARYAVTRGWADLSTPDGWFILIKLASGGEADFNFGDFGDYIFMINRKDAARGDVSRVYAFVESG